MASFLETQLDFIYFFYGLAFILLGVLCLVIGRGTIGRAIGISLLGLFGIIHGGVEWMDLATLIAGDSPEFAIVRCAAMTISFVFLTEFARKGIVELGIKLPGPWIYVPLLLLIVAAGVFQNLATANALARYMFGAIGAFGTSIALIGRLRLHSEATRRLTIWGAAVFALYGLAAGVIVPEAPFWPANVLNQSFFVQLTGIPIQLVRGLIACTLAVLIWAAWGAILARDVDSPHYKKYLRGQFLGTLAGMAVIFVCGWILTDFLGGIYRDNVEDEAKGDVALLASRLSGETAMVDAMAKVLARTPAVQGLLSGQKLQESAQAQLALEVGVEASGAVVGEILDASGDVIASSNPREFALLGAPNQSQTPWFQSAAKGLPDHHFEFDNSSSTRFYYASYPVRASGGGVVGSVVLKKSLDALEVNLREFDQAFFFIDSEGVVMLTNRSDELGRRLWPGSGMDLTLGQQSGSPVQSRMLEAEIKTSGWTTFGGRRSYVLRAPVKDSQWSMLIALPVTGIFASRFLGIIITLQFAITTLFYFFGREHGVRDSILLQRRLELQNQARSLQVQATTDPLTGLHNRLKFNEDLEDAMARSRRSQRPFSLVLYDIDHFKEVNDVFGHQAGDQVLVQLSSTVAGCLREIDSLARWGGEEFVILLDDTDCENAYLVAEKLRDAIAHASFEQVGTITCSFGVAEYGLPDTAETMLARADNALYRAKMNGRNRVELDAPVVETTDLAPVS